MFCIKCGRETREHQVFCDACLADMERYPVDPGLPVQLPRRVAAVSSKKSAQRRKQLKPEEQLRKQSRVIRGLVIAVVVLTLALALTAGALTARILEQPEKTKPIGQNYSTMDATAGS